MTERPLGAEELAGLRSLLLDAPAPEPRGDDWDGLLRRLFDAGPDTPLHSGLEDTDLLPAHWPTTGSVEDTTFAPHPEPQDDLGPTSTDHPAFTDPDGLDPPHHRGDPNLGGNDERYDGRYDGGPDGSGGFDE